MSSQQDDWGDRRTMDGDAGVVSDDAPRDVSYGDATTQDGRADDMPEDVLGRIDQFEILKELGTGGFGSVYLARDTTSRTFVAVKGLPQQVKDSEDEMANIRTNFALVSKLHHENIAAALVLHPASDVRYADTETARKLNVQSGQVLMVMQYASGVTLTRWRKQFPEGKVPFDQAVEVTRQIAAALDFAHRNKIIHRDVKPANVMVETAKDGTFMARVLDFGLAAEVRSSMNRVSKEVSSTSGRGLYMSPEQWTGRRQGAATDQYALAVLFYELVTGEIPFASAFECDDPIVMMTAVKTQDSEIPEDLPKPVRRALLRALAKDAAARFASCADFVAALEGKKVAGMKKPSSGSKSLRAASVAALLLVGGLGGWWFQRIGGQSAVSADSAVPFVSSVASVPSGARKPGETRTLTLPGGAQLEMVWCPPGSFTMGSPESEEGHSSDETPHRVRLTKGFWIGKYEVTQAQWESVMGNNPSNFKGADRPVEQVSWDECQAFCRKAGQGLRLPTEAEWEYACRAGTTTSYAGTGKLDDMGWYSSNTGSETSEVGKKRPNAWGLYDMHGNVWEWCADWYGSYSEDATDPTGPASGVNRVLRGGSWLINARYCRSANRYWYSPGLRYNDLGFRLCCSAGPSE